METGGVLSAIEMTTYGLMKQMKKLELISENIANAEKLPDENGKVYCRKMLVDAAKKERGKMAFGDEMVLKLRKSRKNHLAGSEQISFGSSIDNNYQFKIVEDKTEKLIYDPSHPKADENGYLKVPNVNVLDEMIEMISVSRVYEANVSVIEAAKQMAKNTLRI